jgi:P pilus assembly chaperone PapD
MPVFVVSTHPAFSNLRWQALRLADGHIQLRATNTGNAHVQIGALELAPLDGAAPVVRQSVASYVLPGNTRSWTLKGAVDVSPGAILRLHATTDAGDVQARVALGNAESHEPAAPVSRP